ncbi:hypothetical protein PVAP13_3KG507701 [Panicum virgatum]|uniref:Uncharacterized protein n=1 Tax=Panicum virgatum TaxID=38727 RepID=A0A8T0V651_PANVG|nr:hypothetical protein PVAP13_3KG507701 [Panicum virgatum]
MFKSIVYKGEKRQRQTQGPATLGTGQADPMLQARQHGPHIAPLGAAQPEPPPEHRRHPPGPVPISPPPERPPEARAAARKAAAGLRPTSFSTFLHLTLSLAGPSMAAAAAPGNPRPEPPCVRPDLRPWRPDLLSLSLGAARRGDGGLGVKAVLLRPGQGRTRRWRARRGGGAAAAWARRDAAEHPLAAYCGGLQQRRVHGGARRGRRWLRDSPCCTWPWARRCGPWRSRSAWEVTWCGCSERPTAAVSIRASRVVSSLGGYSGGAHLPGLSSCSGMLWRKPLLTTLLVSMAAAS